MRVTFRKKSGIDVWVVYRGDEKTNYTLTKENFGSGIYYLFRQGERVLRRFNDIDECIAEVKVMFLDMEADRILGGK